jgi:hypothetical protein
MMSEPGCLRFVPSRVDGLADVTEVTVYPDRLELLSAGRLVSYRLEDIATWPKLAFIRRWLARRGWKPRCVPVGEHKCVGSSSERYFRFYTWPQIVIYMPAETAVLDYNKTLDRRVQDIMREGGFRTWDLGSTV